MPSQITKKTVRGDSSIELLEEEIAAPPTDIQDAVAKKHVKLHAADHGDGQTDEINVVGLSGELVDPQPPKLHVTTHESGQADEIALTGLLGETATPQPPKTHGASHENTGADEISLAGLSGESVTPQPPKAHKPSHVEGGADPFDDGDTVNLGKLKTGLTTERYTKTLTTVNDTPADIDAIPVAEGRVVDVEAVVIARKADGSERGVYHLEGVFHRNSGGDVTQQGNTASLLIRRSTSSLIVDIVPDTGNQTVDVRVTGLAVTTVKWEARVIMTNLVG